MNNPVINYLYICFYLLYQLRSAYTSQDGLFSYQNIYFRQGNILFYSCGQTLMVYRANTSLLCSKLRSFIDKTIQGQEKKRTFDTGVLVSLLSEKIC